MGRRFYRIQVRPLICAWNPPLIDRRPERWDHLTETVSGIPGVWGNMMTFIGGPKACIGYRFSIVE